MLLWPYQYTRLIGSIPSDARPLAPVKDSKRHDYLKVAEIMLSRVPCATTARAVQFLIRVCDEGFTPDHPPDLPWLGDNLPEVPQIGVAKLVSRLAPIMRFHAKHNRQR